MMTCNVMNGNASSKQAVRFPQHMLLVGRTASGKTSLVGDILSNVDQLYHRETKDNIVVILSPHDTIDPNFIRRFNSAEDWKILHFTIESLNADSMENVLKYLESENLLKKEVFLFLDDLAIEGYSSKRVNGFILKAFATFRHHNIAVIATIQSGDKEFKPLMQNSGYIILMKHFGYHKCLEMILRTFIMSIKIPALIRSLSNFFGSVGDIGEHISFNFSPAAMKNKIFFITNNVFCPYYGYTRENIEQLCLQL